MINILSLSLSSFFRKMRLSRHRYIYMSIMCVGVIGIGVYASFIFAQDQSSDDNHNRNPFVALITPDGRLIRSTPPAEAVQQKDIVIEGVMVDNSGKSYVVGNGEVATVGEMLGGFKVVGIDQRKVVLSKDGQIKEVQINKEEDK